MALNLDNDQPTEGGDGGGGGPLTTRAKFALGIVVVLFAGLVLAGYLAK